jgi:branched-chain amino acid transport system ATP-binding protein
MSATSETPTLALNGITAGYGRTVVLRDVTVTVPPRSIVAVLGPNGAGKTTLLRVAAGLLTPRDGEVRLDGDNVTRQPAHQRARGGLCLMPEGRGIFRSLSVAENLVMYTPPWMREERLERALDAFPILRDRLKSTAGTLSGGQQQMLAVARIYVSEPRVVLFDEVSMGLAPLVVAEIFAAITQLAKDGISIVLVEQYVNRALAMADHAYMISRGRVTFSGPPSELDEQTVLSGYLGSDLTTT